MNLEAAPSTLFPKHDFTDQYGYTSKGVKIEPPDPAADWERQTNSDLREARAHPNASLRHLPDPDLLWYVLPGDVPIPAHHMEYHDEYGWLIEQLVHTALTPPRTGVNGFIRAYGAVTTRITTLEQFKAAGEEWLAATLVNTSTCDPDEFSRSEMVCLREEARMDESRHLFEFNEEGEPTGLKSTTSTKNFLERVRRYGAMREECDQHEPDSSDEEQREA